jgi:hypothetical protein
VYEAARLKDTYARRKMGGKGERALSAVNVTLKNEVQVIRIEEQQWRSEGKALYRAIWLRSASQK